MNANLPHFAIIVAGGKGLRMGTELPKQFLILDGTPVLVHTIRAFISAVSGITIVLVLPDSHLDYWNSLAGEYFPNQKIQTVSGGKTRYHSVKNGLNRINKEEGLVAVHDAVRPCISHEIIRNSFLEAQKNKSAIVSVPLKDSIREVTKESNKALDRSKFRLIQTPQTFDLKTLKASYELDYQSNFTDDASVVESFGETINLIEGDYRNLKITTPEDLKSAELFIKEINLDSRG